jgi:hypothetical protein
MIHYTIDYIPVYQALWPVEYWLQKADALPRLLSFGGAYTADRVGIMGIRAKTAARLCLPFYLEFQEAGVRFRRRTLSVP